MKVRMTRYVESFVQVLDLLPGEVYDLKDSVAAQFLDNGMAEPADRAEAPTLESAAMAPPRRRG